MKTRFLLMLMTLIALSMNIQAQPGNGDGPPDGGGSPPDGGGPGGGDAGGAEITYVYGTDINSLWTSESDYYYIVGLIYCQSPADTTYEQMGIYVPSAYLTQNSDGSFSINSSGTCNGYTAATAPIVVPVNTSVASYSTTDELALSSFAGSYKKATKDLGAFDEYADLGSAENTLMGIAGTAGHFDKYLAELVNTYASSYYSAFTNDLAETNVDAVGKDVETRLMMYTPLYYLVDNSTYYDGGGSGSSDVAPFWRIRTGIKQEDTALSTEINLALALEARDDVQSVDFETIWDQGHTEAEDTGSASENFIAWVKDCVEAYGTGIDEITTVSIHTLDNNYYLLDGRCVSNPTQGFYIHNGKKIVIIR